MKRASHRAPIKDDPKVSGGDFEEATPDPIPNSEVKLFGADGTAREAVWESRTPPGLFPKAREKHLAGFFHFVPRASESGAFVRRHEHAERIRELFRGRRGPTLVEKAEAL